MADDSTSDSTIRRLCTALESNNWPAARAALEAALNKVETASFWRTAITTIIQIGKPHPEISTGFHTLWTERGGSIREQAKNDDLLRDALRILLPAYVGPGLKLYRGENIDRWRAQAYGFAWTDKIDIARMFARGLNAMAGQGGVLLSADAPTEAIIAGLNEYTIRMGEYGYVVDWRQLRKITPLERFPPSK